MYDSRDSSLHLCKRVKSNSVSFRLCIGNIQTDLFHYIQTNTVLRLQNFSMLIYVLVTDVHHPDLRVSVIRAGFCLGRENVVYLYTQLVCGVVKANTGNSIVLCVAHMSGSLLLGPLTLRHN